jgi:outer membrane biosynthesis protein TonB
VRRLLAKSPDDRPAMLAIAGELRALGSDVLPLAPTIGDWHSAPPKSTPTTLGMGTGEVRSRRVRHAIAGSIAAALLVGVLVVITSTRASTPSGLHDAPPAPPPPPPAAAAKPRAPEPAVPAPVPPPVVVVTPPPTPVAPPPASRPPAARPVKPAPPTPVAPTPPPPPPRSQFDGVELGSDGIPTKRRP